jgi:predicted transcriptional regulator of viral defense system
MITRLSNAVLSLIQDSPEGITTAELEKKTGLKDKQIWAIVNSAKKAGKISQVKRGLYVGA